MILQRIPDRSGLSPLARLLGFVVACFVVGVAPALAEPPATATRAPSGTTATTGRFRVVGYLPEYRAPGLDFSKLVGLTDLIVFSAEPEASGALDLSRLKAVPWPELHALRSRHQTRLHLAIGGWGLSRHFKTVAASPGLRSTFSQQALKTASDLHLDGIDLDWEHPANPAEVEDYGRLLSDLRDTLAPKGLSLAVTVAGWQRLTPLAIRSADLVQLMAYDRPGHHSTFEGTLADLASLARQGVPRAKTVLGLPLYGRHITQRDQTLTYQELLQRFAPAPGADEAGGYAFNGPETLRRKVAHARDEGLAGVMIWELGQDAPGDKALLPAVIAEATGRPGPRSSTR